MEKNTNDQLQAHKLQLLMEVDNEVQEETKYLNQFHKESTERKMKKLEEQKNLKLNSKEEENVRNARKNSQEISEREYLDSRQEIIKITNDENSRKNQSNGRSENELYVRSDGRRVSEIRGANGTGNESRRSIENSTTEKMKTIYITEGEIHAQVNLTDEEYKELQHLLDVEENPVSEERMTKLILQAVKNLQKL